MMQKAIKEGKDVSKLMSMGTGNAKIDEIFELMREEMVVVNVKTL